MRGGWVQRAIRFKTIGIQPWQGAGTEGPLLDGAAKVACAEQVLDLGRACSLVTNVLLCVWASHSHLLRNSKGFVLHWLKINQKNQGGLRIGGAGGGKVHVYGLFLFG